MGFNLEPRRIWNYHISILNMWVVQILKRGIDKTRCKPMRNLAKIQISPKHVHTPCWWQRPTMTLGIPLFIILIALNSLQKLYHLCLLLYFFNLLMNNKNNNNKNKTAKTYFLQWGEGEETYSRSLYSLCWALTFWIIHGIIIMVGDQTIHNIFNWVQSTSRASFSVLGRLHYVIV